MTATKQFLTLFGLVCVIIPCIVACDTEERTDQWQALTDIQALYNAIFAFRAEYGGFPYDGDLDRDMEIDLGRVVTILAGGTNSVARQVNAKGIHFVTPGQQFRFQNGEVIDPWGGKFNLWVDGNRDGKIMLGGRERNVVFMIWSNGRNGTNEFCFGDDISHDSQSHVPY